MGGEREGGWKDKGNRRGKGEGGKENEIKVPPTCCSHIIYHLKYKHHKCLALFTVHMASPGVPVMRILGRLRHSTLAMLARGALIIRNDVPPQNKINVKSNRQSHEVGLCLKPRGERQKLPSVAIVETVK